MIVEYKFFTWISAFFFIIAIAYGLCTDLYTTGGIEWTGTTALVLSGGLGLLIGGYFWLISRRLEKPRPEDNSDATINEHPEELGFFSPGSFWPVIVASTVVFVALSLALGYFWLIFPAAILVILAAGGLVFEYHKPPERH